MAGESIAILLKSKQTVFTIKELTYLWQIFDEKYLKSKIYFLTKKGDLIRLRKGIYTLSLDYDKYELAGKLKTPSYISLETVLRNEGVIFQHYRSIFSVSNLSRIIVCNKQEFIYRKIKDDILLNLDGIIKKENYYIASVERAFLDAIYLYKNYYFDNLSKIDWQKCNKLIKIYHSDSLLKRLNQYYKNAKHK
ncbi:MAG: hypothetical protein AB1465_00990 [Patescibacteria group bacterium]